MNGGKRTQATIIEVISLGGEDFVASLYYSGRYCDHAAYQCERHGYERAIAALVAGAKLELCRNIRVIDGVP
jgi:hypothetical protein